MLFANVRQKRIYKNGDIFNYEELANKKVTSVASFVSIYNNC